MTGMCIIDIPIGTYRITLEDSREFKADEPNQRVYSDTIRSVTERSARENTVVKDQK